LSGRSILKKIINRIKSFVNVFRSPVVSPPKTEIFTKDDERYKNFLIGDYTYGSPRVKVYDPNTNLKIGKFCSIAENVSILLGGEHITNWVSTYPFPFFFDSAKNIQYLPLSKGDIVIGNDVWIGYGTIILSGVTIGDGSVIAAGSVITKSVAPYAIVGGNPAKLIRYRFSAEIILMLEKMQWWEWPLEKIIASAPIIMSDRVDEFVKTFAE
jgi:virginiamycin A acetyltransferase